jgi:hypothetical protein
VLGEVGAGSGRVGLGRSRLVRDGRLGGPPGLVPATEGGQRGGTHREQSRLAGRQSERSVRELERATRVAEQRGDDRQPAESPDRIRTVTQHGQQHFAGQPVASLADRDMSTGQPVVGLIPEFTGVNAIEPRGRSGHARAGNRGRLSHVPELWSATGWIASPCA